ncbi:MAG: polyribonucleotide nucleotidyltransferase [Patescibacteria group bacterium]
MKTKEYVLEVNGKNLTCEFNDLANQANGSCIIKYGDTSVLATAVISKFPKDNFDFFPLTVDFEEKFYAIGKILGGQYTKREGRPTDDAILSGRIVDRTIRPLFEDHIRHEVQVTLTVLSLGEDDPDVLAVIAASLALGTSNIPWRGPTSAIRIGKYKEYSTPKPFDPSSLAHHESESTGSLSTPVNGTLAMPLASRNKNKKDLIINPTYKERGDAEFEFDVLACGKDNTLNMIEAAGKETKEEDLKQALQKAVLEIEKIQNFQKKIIEEIGKEKLVIEKIKTPENIEKVWEESIAPQIKSAIFSDMPIFENRGEEFTSHKKKIRDLEEVWMESFAEKNPNVDTNLAKNYFEIKVNDLIHKEAIENDRRPDGRKIDELRPLFAKAGGISKILHGSGIFYRGGTHVFSALTLGGPGDSQTIDGMETQTQKRFMHHYNFPPFSVGETGRMGGMNRRAIGHGALAEKALLPILPEKENFPYTIRVVSECMASNGSTSMASVCAGTLALMDGGVPIKSPAAGVAIGLMMQGEKYKILTDIQGPEDHYGDMDFKVAGTKNGVTAIQMDVKVEGIPMHILCEALDRAQNVREQILRKIQEEIKSSRETISPNAPRIMIVKIKPEQIGLVIGPGGKSINQIKELTGVEIDIEEDGSVFITGKNDGPEKAAEMVRGMTKEYKAGERFTGEITKIVEFGAFVRIGQKTEGLLHISEIATTRIEKVEDILSIGEKIPVIIKEMDDKGRMKLSLKAIEPEFFKNRPKKR